MFSFFDNDLLSLSNSIRQDVERSLDTAFDQWDLIESEPAFFDPRHSSYRMKMVVNDNGHVTVKTAKKNPNGPWRTYVKTYDDQGKALKHSKRPTAITQGTNDHHQRRHRKPRPIEQANANQRPSNHHLKLTHHNNNAHKQHQHQHQHQHKQHQLSMVPPAQELFPVFDEEIYSLSDAIRRDVERSLGQDFHTWDLWESEPSFFDPRHTSYRMKMMVNDNGHVTVKTAKKDPDGPWQTYVKSYDEGDKALEDNNKNNQAVTQENAAQQSTAATASSEQSNRGSAQNPNQNVRRGEDIEIEDVTSAEQTVA